ncbi:MAG TPA: hypothetical protein VGK90_03570 [Rhizomicrobium sp.]
MQESSIVELVHRHPDADGAIGIFREMLPHHGFKLVMPPALEGKSPWVFASVWKSGDLRSVAHKGTNAARALLRATEYELAALRNIETMMACDRCHGLGWYVEGRGILEVCRHPKATESH